MSSQARWIKSKAKGSLNPVQVETTLSEIASGWDGSLPDFLHDFPLGEEALIHLLAVSQICAERLQRDPGLLRWLARPEISMYDRGSRAIHESRMAQPAGGTDCKIDLWRRTVSVPNRSAIAAGGLSWSTRPFA